jgi:hypothetical protein
MLTQITRRCNVMRRIILRGLAEGLVGRSSVMASSVAAVFAAYPALEAARGKLSVSGNTISGFSACDG